VLWWRVRYEGAPAGRGGLYSPAVGPGDVSPGCLASQSYMASVWTGKVSRLGVSHRTSQAMRTEGFFYRSFSHTTWLANRPTTFPTRSLGWLCRLLSCTRQNRLESRHCPECVDSIMKVLSTNIVSVYTGHSAMLSEPIARMIREYTSVFVSYIDVKVQQS
jgi:hypothetical protein